MQEQMDALFTDHSSNGIEAIPFISQWATFELFDESYGVNVMNIREVLRYQPITQVPGSPAFVEGIINLRGNVITVVNMRTRLGMQACTATDSTRILIAEVKGYLLGFIVDSASEVLELDSSEIVAPPNNRCGESGRYIAGVIYIEDQLLILLNLEKIVEDDINQFHF